jgi:hypothetical protein
LTFKVPSTRSANDRSKRDDKSGKASKAGDSHAMVMPAMSGEVMDIDSAFADIDDNEDGLPK